jgi:MFS family permease
VTGEERPRGARIAVSTYFLLLGITSAVWVARIPAVKERLALSDGQLGIALLGLPVGLVLGTLAAGHLVDRFGSGRMTRVAGVVSCLLLLSLGIAGNMAELMAALLGAGVAGGTLDVSMNSHGVRVETAYRRPVMASMHACYSLGGFAGALFGGAFAWAGIGPEPAFVAAGLPAAVVAAGAGRWLSGLPAAAPDAGGPRQRSPAGPDTGDPAGSHRPPAALPDGTVAVVSDGRLAGTPAPAGAGAAGQRPSTAARPRVPGTGWLVLALGILGLCALVAEGAAGDWSAVYLHDNLGASAGLAAVGYGVFSVMMTAGRLAGDRLAARFGPVRLARWCGLIAAAGLAGGLVSHSIAGGLAGFAVLGAGLSCVVPQVFSAGGRADPLRPGRGLARVVGLGYLGLAGGPVVIGACASLTGLPVALGIPVVLCLWVAVSARALAPRVRRPA